MSENTIYVAFDLETGGLVPSQADILTGWFGFFDKDFKLLDELPLKLKPDNGRLPMADAGALKVNGINIKEHLEDSETVTYSEGKKLLLEKAQKYLKRNGKFSNLIPTGFNIIGFDIKMINEHLVDAETWNKFFHYKNLDVMNATDFLRFCGWIPSDTSRLTQLADYFGVAQGTAHTAKFDTLMTIELLKKLKELMDSKKSGGQAVDLISLLEAE